MRIATVLTGALAAFLISLPVTGAEGNQTTAPPTLKIIHFDVGPGDFTLIIYENPKNEALNRTLLIDGATRSMARKVVIPGIVRERIKNLDYVIATQYGQPHFQGVKEVIRVIPMSGNGAVYTRDNVWTTKSDGSRVRNPPLNPGFEFSLGEKLTVKYLASGGMTDAIVAQVQQHQRDQSHDENSQEANTEASRSLAFKITFDNFQYFIGGDLTGGGQSGFGASPNLETLVARNAGRVDVLRVNNHGSPASSNAGFLSTLDPSVAIISAGQSESRNSQLAHTRA